MVARSLSAQKAAEIGIASARNAICLLRIIVKRGKVFLIVKVQLVVNVHRRCWNPCFRQCGRSNLTEALCWRVRGEGVRGEVVPMAWNAQLLSFDGEFGRELGNSEYATKEADWPL